MKFNKDQDYWVNIFATKEFLCIDTYSGLGRTGGDPLFPSHLLPVDADEQCIGTTILQALSDSRTLNTVEERLELFDLEKSEKQYKDWIAMLMGKYGYKTKRALFKDMKNCGVHCVNGVITISPSYHVKLEAWEGLGDGIGNVVLSTDNTAEEIGAGFRLALSRCEG